MENLYNKIFEKNHFKMSKNTVHSIEFKYVNGIDYIYLADRIENITIVVNPITVEKNNAHLIQELIKENEEDSFKDALLFGSSYTKFEKRLSKKAKNNHCGYAYRFNSPEELDSFLKILSEIFDERLLIDIEFDYKLIFDLSYDDFLEITPGFENIAKPIDKKGVRVINNHKVYLRDKQTSLNALSKARLKCEIDSNHPTFIRKNSNVNYTEPHHLIPMCYQDFDKSLDVEANIISLCSNCHNQIHHGKDAEKLFKRLYNERIELLKAAKIVISFENLKKMYS